MTHDTTESFSSTHSINLRENSPFASLRPVLRVYFFWIFSDLEGSNERGKGLIQRAKGSQLGWDKNFPLNLYRENREVIMKAKNTEKLNGIMLKNFNIKLKQKMFFFLLPQHLFFPLMGVVSDSESCKWAKS